MDNLTNYHSHCTYCDGRADMEPFVRFAVARGFTSYGFSSHAPLPFSTRWTMEWDRMDDYLSDFRRLRAKYANRIELYVGLEIDYLNDESHPATDRFQRLPLDYRIGSVHTLYDDEGHVVDIDLPADAFRRMVDHSFGGDVEHVLHLYYERVMRMIELGGFDIVGHADKPHRNAALLRPYLLDEPWYDDLLMSVFRAAIDRGMQIEVNTKGLFDVGTFFPNQRYFRRLCDMGAMVQVNSDAHYPDLISNGRAEALTALKRAGFTTVMELVHGRWTPVPIADRY